MRRLVLASIMTLGAIVWAVSALPAAASLQPLSGTIPGAIKDLNLQPIGRLPADQTLNLAIGLPVRDQDGLIRFVAGVSDPSSPDYGHYLAPGQFAAAYGPTAGDYQAVIDFARANQLAVTEIVDGRLVVGMRGTVAAIEKAFHVRMMVYQHPTENRTFYAPDVEPALDLAAPVQDIQGLSDFVLPRALVHPTGSLQSPQPQDGSGPSGGYMGNDFRHAYVPGYTSNGTGQKVGLLEFDSGFYQADITYYESLAGLPNTTVTPVLLDGYNGGGGGGGNVEVSLDIEMAISLAQTLSEVRVYEGDVTNDILGAMANDTSVLQFGASWGYDINTTSNNLWLQMAAQGQSFYNASGDSDAYTGPIQTPCDNPYIISVGGTTLTMTSGGGAYVSETVWNWTHDGDDGVGSSGGISTTYSIPPWQGGVNMSGNQGSNFKRDIPDVGMTADNVYVRYHNGRNTNVGGTSCATPLWAAFTALVNELGAANGHAAMGFINPAVYQIGKGQDESCYFHDTVTGDNTWSRSPSKFHAVAGYDLCVGWGCPTTDLLYGLIQISNNCQQFGSSVGANPAVKNAAALVLPNPAPGRCTVSFEVASAGPVRVEILDVGGRVIRSLADGSMAAGPHSVRWDGRDETGRTLGSGVYLARILSGNGVATEKVILAR